MVSLFVDIVSHRRQCEPGPKATPGLRTFAVAAVDEMPSISTLRALCNANRGILGQKLWLIERLVKEYGPDQAGAIYGRPCRLVKASIGQHVRHSLDHIDLAVAAAGAKDSSRLIHYDLRRRGGSDESDLNAASERIRRVDGALQNIMNDEQDSQISRSVQACFMLSGDDDKEYILPSTVARELSFAAHHAIHHMAMIRIIAESEAFGIRLPADFGKAPSTVNFERDQ